ncbi:hypothetical protein DM02DRAFT_673217 [Periconia macrospinosa]|uniref:DUF7580 domain-containing protein n=1 Tax=Periconia macrospinosa TaxID=97972 RepID=A0A2V1DM17_9PLEO|nr:hypothetical protein DM02DRAFT_673217 [Periconia macrospinosa]
MVTGVETAGLVLGSLPLVIEGLKAYQKGIKTIKRSIKYDSSLKKLIRGVTEQKIWLEDNLDKLLLAAGNASGINISTGSDHWSEISIGQSGKAVKDYLGETKQAQFKDLMEDFESTLLEIANALHTVQRSRKKESGMIRPTRSDIQKLALTANVQGKLVTKRIWYLIEEATILSLTKDLHDLNSQMNRILKNNRELHELKSIQASKIIPDERKASAIASLLRQIRTYTDRLFEAFCKAWVSSCHPSHNVALFLDVPAFSSNSWSHSGISSFNFRTLLNEWPQDVQVLPSWHEVGVTVVEGDSSQIIHSHSTTTSNNNISAPPSITINPPTTPITRKTVEQVKNLCIELTQAKTAQKSLDLLLRCGHPVLCYDLNTCQKKPSSMVWDTISLDELLTSQKRILPRQKVRLALKLAASLLQLKTSQWLCATWSNRAIYFPKKPSSANQQAYSIEIEQPLILYTFDSAAATATAKVSQPTNSSEAKPRLMFLELGILLLEIFNEEPIGTFAQRERGITPPMHPMMREGVARDWFDETSEQMTDQYAKVVETCLSFALERAQTGLQTWDDDDLWKSVCAKIIGPLNQECGTFRGGV